MAQDYGLNEFAAEVRAAMARQAGPEETLRAIAPSFRRLLGNRSFLRERIREIGAHSDEVRLYADPQHGFVVLARGVSQKKTVQGKSHAAVPHDHGPLWALYGIYEGSSELQRYEPDPAAAAGPFPGLRMTAAVPAKAGDFDAIPPHSMHLPMHTPGEGTVILVVYSNELEQVERRGYVASAKAVVKFKGTFPPLELPAAR